MDYSKFIKIVKAGIKKSKSNRNKFTVKFKNGKTKDITYVEQNGLLYYLKDSRAHIGYGVSMWYPDDVVSIKVKNPFKPTVALVRKRAKDGVDMLTRSGLWSNVKADFEAILAMSDSQIAQFIKDCKEDFYNLVYHDEANRYGSIEWKEAMENLIHERCWTSIPFAKYSRSRLTGELDMYIKNRENYTHRWSNGYDCTIEVRFDREDNIPRGWLSMEYVGCGNGHYYILLDEKHALFAEDD